MMYLGIDPGFSGAWGMIDHNGQYIACSDMEHDGYQLKTNDMLHKIDQARNHLDMLIVIEKVHSMPSQGVASTFKFGLAYGSILALAERFNFETQLVTPQKWKKDLGLTSNKNDSLILARKLWNEAPLARKKDNGRAEALLLAYWLKNEMS